MSLTSAASTRVTAAAGGIDAMPAEPHAAPPVSGFELLLAGAQQPPGDASKHDSPTAAEPKSTSSDTATGNTKDPSAQPPAKPAANADSTGLLGALAPAPPPVAPADATPPPAGTTDPAPVTDVTTAPAPTMLGLVAAALTPDPSTGDAAPADPPSPPAVQTDLSSLLGPAPRDAATSTPPVAYTPAAPPPSVIVPNPSTSNDSSSPPAPATPSTSTSTSRPGVVDSAAPPPTDRPHPQAASSAAPSGAASFTPPAPTPAAGPQAAGDWAAATATVAPPPPAEQLVSVLTPLRTTPTGSYTLRLELKPPEMGRIEMRVEMRDGVLHASIHAEHEGAAQLVRDSLGELRDRLNAEGVRTGDLTVSDGGVGPGSHDGEDAPASGSPSSSPSNASSDDPALASAMQTSTSPDSTSLLDVRV
jgi:hypothetical protein